MKFFTGAQLGRTAFKTELPKPLEELSNTTGHMQKLTQNKYELDQS